VRLADARLTADEHHRAGHDAAAEHEVKLVDARRHRASLRAACTSLSRGVGDDVAPSP
jgi:hypothetical protein